MQLRQNILVFTHDVHLESHAWQTPFISLKKPLPHKHLLNYDTRVLGNEQLKHVNWVDPLHVRQVK